MEDTLRLPGRLPRSVPATPAFVWAGVFVSFALLSTIAVIAYRGIAAFEDSTHWVAHSDEIIAELGQLAGDDGRLRLAWRRYLARQSPDALDDYRTSRAEVQKSAAKLAELTVDNPDQHARMVALGDAIRQDLQSIDASIAQRPAAVSHGEPPAAIETAETLPTDGERISNLADAAEQVERGLLAAREQATSAEASRAKAWIVAGNVASLLTLAIVFFALRGEVNRRSRAQARIERYAGEVAALNAQLRAYSERVEASNRELESFSYSVSHDLRAPLRAINGFASMLAEDHAANLDTEGQRLLAIVRSSADAMGRLIDDLLAFSRLGKVAFVAAPVDMVALVNEVLVEHGGKHDMIVVGPLPAAHGDRSLVKQVWANLIDNAVKYSAKVAQPRIRIGGGVNDDGFTQYRIEDNGAGFDMRYYEKLFGVFQRLHSASEFPGTGVGLAIVQRIVARHGGRVWGEGRPGEGATFYFTLPAGRPK
ncbi:MAG TPA: ATP-binding protein [Casimicrobiaceae bacterium]|nr:ATP-binding protein [Casimicrobiaceae bacterium]